MTKLFLAILAVLTLTACIEHPYGDYPSFHTAFHGNK